MKLSEIAARIDDNLKRFEADPEINRPAGFSRMKPYFGSRAGATGRYVFVIYIDYQRHNNLSKSDALKYLAWLDAGNVGKHWEALK